MPRTKKTSTEKFGPYFEEYEIEGADGDTYIRKVPAYREVMTAQGVMGVPANSTLHFEDTPKGPVAVIEPVDTPASVTTRKKPGPKGPRSEKADEEG